MKDPRLAGVPGACAPDRGVVVVARLIAAVAACGCAPTPAPHRHAIVPPPTSESADGGIATAPSDLWCSPLVYEDPGCARAPTCDRNLDDYGRVAVCTCSGQTVVYETYKIRQPFSHRGPCIPTCPAGQRPGFAAPGCELGTEPICVPDEPAPASRPFCGCDRQTFEGPPAPDRPYSATGPCPDSTLRWGSVIPSPARRRVGIEQRTEFGIQNDGPKPARDLSVRLLPPVGAGFSLDDSGCAGRTLPAGAHCTVILRFTASSAGAHPFTLEATSPSAAAPITMPLQELATGPDGLLVWPSRVDFGAQAIGSGWALRRISVLNESDDPARLQLAGATADFRTAVCGPEVPPGQGCALEVYFTPREAGERRATIEITGAAGRAAAELVGAGIAP